MPRRPFRECMRRLLVLAVVSLTLLLGGCVLAPKESKSEKQRLDVAGQPYVQEAIEKRAVPELPSPATWHDVLQRGLLTNGELEAAYFQWRAAMAQVPQVASWPNSSL